MVSSSLKRYFLALNRYKWAAFTSFLGILGISTAFALRPPANPQYRAQGTLVQNFPAVTITATGNEVLQRGQGIISADVLLSDLLLNTVSQELEKQSILIDPQTIRDRTTIEIESDEQGDVQQVLVALTWPDRDVSQTVLSLMFEGMVELSRVTNRNGLLAIIDALNERLPEVEGKLREAEKALETYDRVEGPAIQAAIDGSLLREISGAQQQWRQNQITLAGLQAQIDSLRSRLGMTADEAYVASALSADPIIAQLRSQILGAETQLQLLSDELRPAHPRIQELQADLQSYNQLLRQRAEEVIGTARNPLPSTAQIRQQSTLDPARAQLANQLITLETQRETLLQQQQILLQAEDDLRQQYARLPNKQLERERIAQQVAQRRALYDQIQAKRIDAQAAEAETVPSLTIYEPPTVSQIPQNAQNPISIIIVGGVLGILAGGTVVFLLDALDATVRTHEELQTLLREQEVPLLGLIPTISARNPYTILVSDDSPYADYYERLRSNIRLIDTRIVKQEPQTVLLTSTRAQEGKTLTAYGLGVASARAGKRTLVVEADFHSASAAYRLGVHLPPGAQHQPLLYYRNEGKTPIQIVPEMANLYVSPSPAPQRRAAAIIESTEIKQFLQQARQSFDLIVLDAPPLSHNNDAILLSAQTDGIILMTRPGYTEKAVLEEALEQLLDTEELVVLGSVINGAQVNIPQAPDATADYLEPSTTTDSQLIKEVEF